MNVRLELKREREHLGTADQLPRVMPTNVAFQKVIVFGSSDKAV